MPDQDGPTTLTSRQRRELFLELAARDGGVTVPDVVERARSLGDSATEEAYYNIARRLVHRGAVTSEPGADGRARFARAGTVEEWWIEEDELAELVDPDYPVLALTVWRESRHQINDVPEPVWVELRERLATRNARELFLAAINSYADDFHARIEDLAAINESTADREELGRMRAQAQDGHRLLLRLTKYGLGLSSEAISLPGSVDLAISAYRSGTRVGYVDTDVLREELARRIEDGPFVHYLDPGSAPAPLVGGVDGSTRGGLLSLTGEDGDFNVAHAPLVSINTAVGQINRNVRVGQREVNAFIRLPERPEDMQRRDNRHTVMAKLLHPDLTDAEYMHAVWNAMDLVEARATLRLLHRWYADPHGVEVPPAEVVLRDGTVSPQDRDFTHYRAPTSYGQIVRDLIEANWEIASRVREDARVVCGVVKQSQLGFFAPVINWYACQIAGSPGSQLTAWPMGSMNVIPDQVLVTRLLTAGRARGDRPSRTCVVVRPFHAVTNFARGYARALPPADRILGDYSRATARMDEIEQDDRVFWSNFQDERDPYVKMLRNVHYGSVFLAQVPRLDNENLLPRLEVLVVDQTAEDGPPLWPTALSAVAKAVMAVLTMGYEVAAEHSMFSSVPKLDVLPKLLIKTHETVKTWAQELVGRVQEYVGYHLAAYVRRKRLRGVQVRPFTRAELEALYDELRRERERQAGARPLGP